VKLKKIHFIVLVALLFSLLSIVFIGIFHLLTVHKSGELTLKGENIFMARCASCHSLQKDERRAGPSLYLILGRKAASIYQFPYSRAMRESEIVWDRVSVKQFLKNPRLMVPQNRMAFVGIEDEQEIDALLDFLEEKAR
jgi:cytochrome c